MAQPAGDAAAPDQTVAVLNTRDALKLWLITQEEKGALSAQKGRELWEQWKVYPSKAAAYFSVAQDLAMLHTIAKEFGSPAARVYVKEYKGKPYIILKGHPGIRKVLTGTRYGVEHPKIIGMRLGYRGAAASIREGGMLTIVLVSAFDVLDYFLSDNITLADLVGQLASDFTKVAIATGVTLAASAALAGTVVASVALGPLLAAVVIGVGVGFALDALDNHFHLTERLKTMLNELARNAQEKAEETRQGLLDRAADAVRALISEAVDAVVSSLEQYLWRRINDVQWYLLPRL